MLTTMDILQRLQEANENCTKYRVSKILGVTTATVSRWSHGKNTMDDTKAFQAAQMLGLDPKYVVACVNAERNKGKENYEVWQYICRTIEDENERKEGLRH